MYALFRFQYVFVCININLFSMTKKNTHRKLQRKKREKKKRTPHRKEWNVVK